MRWKHWAMEEPDQGIVFVPSACVSTYPMVKVELKNTGCEFVADGLVVRSGGVLLYIIFIKEKARK